MKAIIRKIAAYTIYFIAYLIAISLTSSFARIGTEHSFIYTFRLANGFVAALIAATLIIFAAYKAIEWAHKELK
jgi:hypothetical protein